MLRTNSTQAKTNIMLYIREHNLDYLEERRDWIIQEEKKEFIYDLENDNDICSFIWDIFKEEKKHDFKRYPIQKVFEDWAQGLALGSLFCYYYNRSAVDDLGAILEETEEEKARFTEEEAAEKLTYLLYREIQTRASFAR